MCDMYCVTCHKLHIRLHMSYFMWHLSRKPPQTPTLHLLTPPICTVGWFTKTELKNPKIVKTRGMVKTRKENSRTRGTLNLTTCVDSSADNKYIYIYIYFFFNVTCHLSTVTFHLSPVPCPLSPMPTATGTEPSPTMFSRLVQQDRTPKNTQKFLPQTFAL